jgi:hypothetical protein
LSHLNRNYSRISYKEDAIVKSQDVPKSIVSVLIMELDVLFLVNAMTVLIFIIVIIPIMKIKIFFFFKIILSTS